MLQGAFTLQDNLANERLDDGLYTKYFQVLFHHMLMDCAIRDKKFGTCLLSVIDYYCIISVVRNTVCTCNIHWIIMIITIIIIILLLLLLLLLLCACISHFTHHFVRTVVHPLNM